jgi:hypothetical protein
MQALRRLRSRWFAIGLVAVAAMAAVGPVRALTTILIEGIIDFVAPTADPNTPGIEAGDDFLITAIFDETLLGGTGRETLTPGTDPMLRFEIRIGDKLVQMEIDDLIHPFGPLINFEDGVFDGFVFQSEDFPFASDAFLQVINDLEILDSNTLDTLVTGRFTGIKVSQD